MPDRHVWLVTGTRDPTPALRQHVRDLLASVVARDDLVVLGDEPLGIDCTALGYVKAQRWSYVLEVAQWGLYRSPRGNGGAAGPIRNGRMVDHLRQVPRERRHVLAFHDNLAQSKGTRGCVLLCMGQAVANRARPMEVADLRNVRSDGTMRRVVAYLSGSGTFAYGEPQPVVP